MLFLELWQRSARSLAMTAALAVVLGLGLVVFKPAVRARAATLVLPPSFQPPLPIRAAVFYPWFPQAWTQQNVFPYTNYVPSWGYYDSSDDALIERQLTLASQAHLQAFVSAWWGPGHYTDRALQHILARSERSGSPYPNLRWAVYYENEALGDPTVPQIVSDLQYLANSVFAQPGYLRVNDRPVVFVYADANDGCGMADRWTEARRQVLGGEIYLVLKVFAGYGSCVSEGEAWHQYAPVAGYDQQGNSSVSVSPGFWLKNDDPRLARDPARFERDVKRMVASGARWQLITTWNEWSQGTAVEPAKEWGNTYIDILCRNLPGSGTCGASGGAPTPTRTSTQRPTATRTAAPTRSTTPTPPSAGSTMTFISAADTYADQSNPSTNYGSSTQIRVDGSPIARSYLRFGVQGLSGTVAKATLRIYANSSSSSGYAVQSVASGTWSESTLTFSNAPALSSTIAGHSGGFSGGAWTAVDVTPLIAGNGTYNIALTTSSGTALNLAAREAGANAPQLVVATQ